MSTETGAAPRRTAAITGAAFGIGREYARRLAQGGIRVVVADLADGSETVMRVEAEGGEAIAVICDVTPEDSFKSLVREVDAFGAVTILE